MQNQLISDILDVSRIVAGKLRLELVPVDLVGVMQAAQDTLSPQALAKDVRLEVMLTPPPGVVMGDAGRLQQIVWNLLSNAMKFSGRGGAVYMRLEAGESHVEIVVEDEGPGIAPEFLPYVFDRFRQADSSSTRPKGGLGLGLAIVRHLVDLHGGTVEAKNRAPHGAAFRVRLPLHPASAGRTGPSAVTDHEDLWPDAAAGAERPLDGLRVLVVDDEEDARDLLATVLGNAGADVITAASAAEVLPLIERERPDVLISDVEMPGEDGYSLIRRVRALPGERGGDTPAVALTAYAAAEDMLRALRAGFQLHIAKPVSPRDLVAVAAGLGRHPPVSR
jgi:CheY-like chemotaxis protein